MSDRTLAQPSGERLALLYRLSQTFNSSLDLDEVLNRVMGEVIAATRAERGFVMLRAADGRLIFRVAQGMDQALDHFGMSEWSVTSKHLDPAGYEPRKLKGMAFSYAVNVRGACHLRATFYKAELSGILKDLDDDAWVQTYIDWEDRMLLLDSLTMCRFYRDWMTWDCLLSSAQQLNGAPVTKAQLEQLSNETMTRIRRLNLAFGLTPAADTVAERFFRDPTDTAPALDREELERRVHIYWLKRGWTKEGLVPAT